MNRPDLANAILDVVGAASLRTVEDVSRAIRDAGLTAPDDAVHDSVRALLEEGLLRRRADAVLVWCPR